MLGEIVLEDAHERAGTEETSKAEAALYIAPENRVHYMRQIHDIEDGLVRLSNAHGIGCTIVSLNGTRHQGPTNP